MHLTQKLCIPNIKRCLWLTIKANWNLGMHHGTIPLLDSAYNVQKGETIIPSLIVQIHSGKDHTKVLIDISFTLLLSPGWSLLFFFLHAQLCTTLLPRFISMHCGYQLSPFLRPGQSSTWRARELRVRCPLCMLPLLTTCIFSSPATYPAICSAYKDFPACPSAYGAGWNQETAATPTTFQPRNLPTSRSFNYLEYLNASSKVNKISLTGVFRLRYWPYVSTWTAGATLSQLNSSS